jgi:hypothetical protein
MALIETERDVHVDADVEVTRTAAGTLVSWPGGFANDRQSDQQREQLLVRLA